MQYEVVAISDDCLLVSTVPDLETGHVYGEIMGSSGFRVIDHTEEKVIERLVGKYEAHLQTLKGRDAAQSP